MRGQGQPTEDVRGFVDGNERLLVAQGHPLAEVLHVEVRPGLPEQAAPDVELVAAQRLVLACGLGDGKREMQVGVLQLVMLLAGRAGPTGLRLAGRGLTMESPCQVQGEGQSTASGCTGQQDGVGEGSGIGMMRQPAGQRLLSDCLREHLCHGPKIAGLKRPASNGIPPSHPGRER